MNAQSGAGGLPWLFPFLFLAVFLLVMFLLSAMSGWRRLAHQYRAHGPAPASRRYLCWGQMGPVYFRNCLTVGGDERGLYLAVFLPFRLFHPPLLIPWSELHGRVQERLIFTTCDTFEVGPDRVRVRIRSRNLERFDSYFLATSQGPSRS